jgi:hypothetical protein
VRGTHIELENPGNHNYGLRPIAVLKHGKPKRLGTIDEESAAKAARILNNPVPPTILPIRKSEDLELEGGSACRMAVSLTTGLELFPQIAQVKLSQQIA